MAGILSDKAGPIRWDALGGVSVLEKGADPTGGRDSSSAFIAAANSLPRGGVVAIPPGKYIVQGLPVRDGLYWVGAGVGKTDGSTGTYLTLPAAPSSSMFIWDGETTGYGGGISGCYLYGGNSTTYDCIDLSASTQMHRFCIEQNMIRGFRRGYMGSDDDRSVQIQFNNFWNCTVGVYIENSHPHFTGWNDFRDCTYGIQGLLYDAKVVGQNFTYCTYGIAPTDSTHRPERTMFTGCAFAFCTQDALVVGPHCNITGCLILSKTEGSVAGIRVLSHHTTISGCQFDADGGVYSEGAIVLDPDYFGGVITGTSITGNAFRVEDSNILYHKASSNGRDIVSMTFTGNTIYESKHLLRRSGNSWGAVLYSVISNNAIHHQTSTLTRNLTGTITFTNGNATVTGSGSAFLTELRIGDWIRLSTDADTTASYRRVQAIASDTSLTLTAVYGATGGAGTGVATSDVIHITNNGGIGGNAVIGNNIVIYTGTLGRAGYGIGGQLSLSTVIGNVVRRGLGDVSATTSTSAQIANNAPSS